jgi:beta-phosphoglucomutase-like phosphatase (HAD superfamily)
VVRSVIFDFDGIIVDSETIFYQINKKACAHFGAEYTMELKHGQMGRKLTEAVDYVLKHSGLAERGVKAQVFNKKYCISPHITLFENLNLFP